MTVSVLRKGTRCLRTAAIHVLRHSLGVLLLTCLLPKVKFFLKYFSWASLNGAEFCVVSKAQLSDKLTLSVTSTVPAPSAFAVLVSSLRRAWYVFLALSSKFSFWGIILHFPKDKCFSRLECHLYIYTQPSSGQENRTVASSLSPSPFVSSSNVPLGPGFLEVSWETTTKSQGETLQSIQQACKKLGILHMVRWTSTELLLPCHVVLLGKSLRNDGQGVW